MKKLLLGKFKTDLQIILLKRFLSSPVWDSFKPCWLVQTHERHGLGCLHYMTKVSHVLPNGNGATMGPFGLLVFCFVNSVSMSIYILCYNIDTKIDIKITQNISQLLTSGFPFLTFCLLWDIMFLTVIMCSTHSICILSFIDSFLFL